MRSPAPPSTSMAANSWSRGEPERSERPLAVMLAPFRDRLRQPPVLSPVERDGTDYYRIKVRAARLRLHADLPPTPLWTYEGVCPGPTIEAHRDRPVEIDWGNELGAARHPIRTFIKATGRWSEQGQLPP